MMIGDGRTARPHDRPEAGPRCRMGAPRTARSRAALSTMSARVRAGAPAAAPARRSLAVEVVRTRGETALVEVRGELDLSTADLLRSRLLDLHASGHGVLVVDFAGVLFCDAAGLGALVAAHNRASGSGGAVRLCRVRPAQRRLLRVTGLDRVFVPYGDADSAMAAGPAPAAR
jgi:anti-anti-sigma factor